MLPASVAKLLQNAQSINIVSDNPVRPQVSCTESAPIVILRRCRIPMTRRKRRTASAPVLSTTASRWESSPAHTFEANKKIRTSAMEQPPVIPVNPMRQPMRLGSRDCDSDSDNDNEEVSKSAEHLNSSPPVSPTGVRLLRVSSPSFNRWDSSPATMKGKLATESLISLRASVKPLSHKPRDSLCISPPKKPIRRRLSSESSVSDTADLLDQALRITGGDENLCMPPFISY